MLTRSVALMLALVASTAFAAEPVPQMVVVQPGYAGSTEDGAGFMATLAGYLSKKAGLPGLAAEYHNRVDKGLQAVEEKRPSVGIVSLGFYLEYRKKLGLRAHAASKPDDAFVVVAPTGTVKPEDLKGKTVAGAPLAEAKFLERIVFAGRADLSAWDLKPTPLTSSTLRSLMRGKYAAAILTGRDYKSFSESIPQYGPKNLEKVLESDYYPPALVVAFGAREESGGVDGTAEEGAQTASAAGRALSSGEVDKVVAAFQGLSKDPEGKEILETMGARGFEPIPAQWLEKLERSYDSHEEEK